MANNRNNDTAPKQQDIRQGRTLAVAIGSESGKAMRVQ